MSYAENIAAKKKTIMPCEHGKDFRDHCVVCDVEGRQDAEQPVTPLSLAEHPLTDSCFCPSCLEAKLTVMEQMRPPEPPVVAQGRLPSGSAARKDIPIATGCLDYFPDALAEIARLSRIGNDKHNPGQPLHWSRGKSNDHQDCLIRHFMERGSIDTSGAEPVLHSIEMAWRALAIAQLEIEERKKAGTMPA